MSLLGGGAKPTWNGNWAEVIPEHEWSYQRPVLDAAEAGGVPFVLGGGLAFSAYSGRVRFTKDLDLFVTPDHRERLIGITREAGLADYFEVQPYDRSWIYRAYRESAIVDIIWTFPNHRTEVRPDWLAAGPEIDVRGKRLRLLRAEQLLWTKLYVMQRERCDWPDLLNLLQAVGPELDWDHLLADVEEDRPVLAGLLSLFGWLSPERARELPLGLWERLCLAPPGPAGPEVHQRRPFLLDTRDWFGPTSGPRETASRGT